MEEKDWCLCQRLKKIKNLFPSVVAELEVLTKVPKEERLMVGLDEKAGPDFTGPRVVTCHVGSGDPLATWDMGAVPGTAKSSQHAQCHQDQETRRDLDPDCVIVATEEYRVRKHVVQEVWQKWKMNKKLIDAFANKYNNQFSDWWGLEKNAWAQDWKYPPLLWVNPPFPVLMDVMDKIREDGAHVVAVLPGWYNKKWYIKAKQMQVDEIVYGSGTKVFELYGRPSASARWNVHIMLLCGHVARCSRAQFFQGMTWKVQPVGCSQFFPPQPGTYPTGLSKSPSAVLTGIPNWTKSAKRRYKRKMLKFLAQQSGESW